ncbi:hypothetical protein Pan97_36990 [Bremerella volcania]|uniref:Uncharacterized protein n=1 Tax=Bremerella volcania TaxID=2527984 RepID=A0A518CBN7_9BACT|nr:hypothetical protein [Bremerella volcania]QDU76645.1 hypothetical protein Pan97_36990 [Bremerella volcania]
MNIATAIPLGIGAASMAAGAARQLSDGVFSLLQGEAEKTAETNTPDDTSLESLLAASGLLGGNVDELQDQLGRSLEDLEDLLRRTFHQAGQDLPESFQLRIDPNGEIAVNGADAFAQQTKGLLQQSEEAQRLLAQIAAQTAAIQAATDQQAFARQYNDDPEAALSALHQAKEEHAGLDLTFLEGRVASINLAAA